MRGLSARVDTKVFLINISLVFFSPIAFDYLDSPATREDIEKYQKHIFIQIKSRAVLSRYLNIYEAVCEDFTSTSQRLETYLGKFSTHVADLHFSNLSKS